MTLEAVLVAVGAIATMIARGRARGPAACAADSRPASRSPATARSRPSQLLRVERIVERAGESGLAAHTQLRPLLVEIAEARLGRRGLRLERRSRPARAGGVGAGAPGPPGAGRRRAAPRLAAGELERMLDRLEAL